MPRKYKITIAYVVAFSPVAAFLTALYMHSVVGALTAAAVLVQWHPIATDVFRWAIGYDEA